MKLFFLKVANFKARGGRRCSYHVAETLTQYIKRLDEGDKRIIGIELKASQNSVFIIDVYMQTNETNSQTNLNKH